MENSVQAVEVSIVLFKVLRKQPVFFLYQHFGRAFLLVCAYKFGLCVCDIISLVLQFVSRNNYFAGRNWQKAH